MWIARRGFRDEQWGTTDSYVMRDNWTAFRCAVVKCLTAGMWVALLSIAYFGVIGCQTAESSWEEGNAKAVTNCVVEIRNVTMQGEWLTISYTVSNPFMDEIWICEELDSGNDPQVETRVEDETVFIRLRLGLECNIDRYTGLGARYSRFLPGQSDSRSISLALPIRNASPLYSFGEKARMRELTTRHRLVLEVGYFDDSLNDAIETEIASLSKRNDSLGNEAVLGLREISEEIHEGQLQKIMYTDHLRLGAMEESATAVFSGINVPCSVMVE